MIPLSEERAFESVSKTPGGILAVTCDEEGDADRVLGRFWSRSRRQPLHLLTIRGTQSRNDAAFFCEISAVMQFPLYFGHNWDALRDSLRDNRARGDLLAVVFADAGQVLRDEPDAKVNWLFEELEELVGEPSRVHEGWQQTTVVMLDTEAGLRALETRLST
jgi:RNAse (barnase) inhibitor barstar